jgi:hypothetical protein
MSVQRERVDGERGLLARKPKLGATRRRTEEVMATNNIEASQDPRAELLRFSVYLGASGRFVD